MEDFVKHQNDISSKENAFVDKLRCASCNQLEKQQFLLKCEHYICPSCKDKFDRTRRLTRCLKCTKFIEIAKGTVDDLEDKLQTVGVYAKNNIAAIDYVKTDVVLQLQQKVNFLQNNLSGFLEQRAKLDIEHSPMLLLKMEHRNKNDDSMADLESELMDLQTKFISIKNEIKKYNLRLDSNCEEINKRMKIIENQLVNNLDSKNVNCAMTINMVNDTSLQNQLLIQNNQHNSYIEIPKSIDKQILDAISGICKEELNITKDQFTKTIAEQNEKLNNFESILCDIKNVMNKQFQDKFSEENEKIDALKMVLESSNLEISNKLELHKKEMNELKEKVRKENENFESLKSSSLQTNNKLQLCENDIKGLVKNLKEKLSEETKEIGAIKQLFQSSNLETNNKLKVFEFEINEIKNQFNKQKNSLSKSAHLHTNNELKLSQNKIAMIEEQLEKTSNDIINKVKMEVDEKVKQINFIEENLKLSNDKLINQTKEEIQKLQDNKTEEKVEVIAKDVSAFLVKLEEHEQTNRSIQMELGDERGKLKNLENTLYQIEKNLSSLNSDIISQNSENKEKRSQLELWMIDFKSKIHKRVANLENHMESLYEESSRCQARANEQYLINSKLEEKVEFEVESVSKICEQFDKQFNELISEAEFLMTNKDQKITEVENSINLLQQELNDQSFIDYIILKLEKQLDSYSIGILMCVEKLADHVQLISKVSEEIQDKNIEKIKQVLNQEIKSVENNLKSLIKQTSTQLMDETQHTTEIYNRSETLAKNFLKLNSTFDLHPFHSLVYVWQIPEITKKMKQQYFQCKSDWFSLPGYKLEACANLDKHCCYFQLEYNRKNLKSTDYVFKVHPKITCVLKDLSGNEKNRDVIRTINCLKNRKMSAENFKFGRFISDPKNVDSIYVRNDAVVFEIHVETPSLVSKSCSNNGIAFHRIDNYSVKKRSEIDELVLSHKSPYFYTKPEGYRVQVLLFLNGTNSNGSLSATIRFLTGDYDLMLSPFFSHKTTVIIFNQSDPTKHLIRCVERDIHNEQEYTVEIEAQKIIENEGFIKNDSLFYKVIIEENCKK